MGIYETGRLNAILHSVEQRKLNNEEGQSVIGLALTLINGRKRLHDTTNTPNFTNYIFCTFTLFNHNGDIYLASN